MAYRANIKTKDEEYYKELILSCIPNCPSGVHYKDISDGCGINQRDVRAIIQKLREDGHPICGTPKDGYWVAQNKGELNETILKLKAQLGSIAYTINCLYKAQESLSLKEE